MRRVLVITYEVSRYQVYSTPCVRMYYAITPEQWNM